ncbi:MAG TPA: hypothetical protein PKV16_06365 [Caldisericia bacterium]|nr:hypothetical protein [Caldisericia bacterium]HPF49187.1 hypothetical protein [Caldisericia bacterium]HPI84134.1 hypothetical protein [Caldisericia bacterium]HPQ93391.1 hypothetical protein [Caldisericia bacterium]HRV75227.1 hypothetical protein [Caldisericia bacterium]
MTRLTVSIDGLSKSKYVKHEAPIVGVCDLLELAREINPAISNHCDVADSYTSGNLCYLGYFIPGDFRNIDYLTVQGKIVKGKFMVS